jgi:hypothetical protein
MLAQISAPDTAPNAAVLAAGKTAQTPPQGRRMTHRTRPSGLGHHRRRLTPSHASDADGAEEPPVMRGHVARQSGHALLVRGGRLAKVHAAAVPEVRGSGW